jgi:hypothetical protein
MTGNAGLVFKNNPLPENCKVFDGNTGQSITLEELARMRAAEQVEKFQNNSSSFTDSLRELSEENWRILLSKLQAVSNVEYDEDFLEPSQDIIKKVAEFMFEANSNLVYEMPLPTFIVPDGEGGVRVEWKLNNKHLRLVYSTQRNYLYLEYNSVSKGIENFDVTQLIESLRWINQI